MADLSVPTLSDTITRIIALSRKDFKSVEAVGLKLMEEVGELAEVTNHHLGYLPHKTMKEVPMGEVADVIQNALALAALVYADKSGPELAEMLEYYLHTKTDKWESIMVEKKPTPTAQDIKNAMCLEGHLNKCLDDVMGCNGVIGGPDAMFNYITAVVHKAIDKSFGIEKTPAQEKAELDAVFSEVFGFKTE